MPATGSHFLLQEPRARVAFAPNEEGYWAHPDFRWSLIPDEMGMNKYFEDAGFELTERERDYPSENAEGSCIGWEPEDIGDGWILTLVLDTEDGPIAVYARRQGIKS